MNTSHNVILHKLGGHLILVVSCLTFLSTSIGCRKFVQISPPPNRITQDNIFSNDQTAISVATGIYVDMGNLGADIGQLVGLLADECQVWSDADPERKEFYENSLKQTGSMVRDLWSRFFNFIFRCNGILEGIKANAKVTEMTKKQLMGEAYFLRAYFNFYLVNLFGPIPLLSGTDPEANRLLQRESVDTVYKSIIDDLVKAQEYLSEDYVDKRLIPYQGGEEQRVRPTKWSSIALLARVYLYSGMWQKAEAEASRIINHSQMFAIVPKERAFLKNNMEAIWQLQPVESGYNTWEGRMFNLKSFPEGLGIEKQVYLGEFLIQSFEDNDARRKYWIDSLIVDTDTLFFPVKYKIGEYNESLISVGDLSEYSTVLRVSEQYLIRAEARIRNGNLKGAISDVDEIRRVANLQLISPDTSPEDLLKVIIHERQVELFTEWGHRWFDLKRLGQLDLVMKMVTPRKMGTWEETDKLLPIPYDDLLYGPKLFQNPGY